MKRRFDKGKTSMWKIQSKLQILKHLRIHKRHTHTQLLVVLRRHIPSALLIGKRFNAPLLIPNGELEGRKNYKPYGTLATQTGREMLTIFVDAQLKIENFPPNLFNVDIEFYFVIVFLVFKYARLTLVCLCRSLPLCSNHGHIYLNIWAIHLISLPLNSRNIPPPVYPAHCSHLPVIFA